MQDEDKAGHIVHGFIHFMEHLQEHAVNGVEQAAQEAAFIKKERPQGFIYRENAVPVAYIGQLEGHICSPFHCVFIAASWAETAFAPERDEFLLPTARAGIHGAAVGRVAAVDHFINVFHFTVTRVHGILNFFIMVNKDLLQYVHEIIIHKIKGKANLTPQD